MAVLSGRELALKVLAEEQAGGTPEVQVRTRKRGVGQWDDLIEASAARHGVDPDLVRAVMRQESGGGRSARSPVGAMGLMQLMPGTARALGVKDPWDPAQNIEGGVKYLSQQLRQFGSVEKALAAYNAGPGAVQKYKGIPPYAETQNYVKKITATYGRQQALRNRAGSAPVQLASRGGAIPTGPKPSGAELARQVLAAEQAPDPSAPLSGRDLALQVLAQEKAAPPPVDPRVEALKRRGRTPGPGGAPPPPAPPPSSSGFFGAPLQQARKTVQQAVTPPRGARTAAAGIQATLSSPVVPPLLRPQGPSAAQAAAQQVVTLPKPRKPGTLAVRITPEQEQALFQERVQAGRREMVAGPRAFNPYTWGAVRKRTKGELAGAMAEGVLFPSGQMRKNETEQEFRELVVQGKAYGPPQLSADPKQRAAQEREIGRLRGPVTGYIAQMRQKVLDPAGVTDRYEAVRNAQVNGRPEEFPRVLKAYQEEEAKRLRLFLDRTKGENVVRYLKAQGHKLTPLQEQAVRNVADAAAHWTINEPRITGAYGFDIAANVIADRFGAGMATRVLAGSALKGTGRKVAGAALEGAFAGGPQQAATRKFADPEASAADLAGEFALGTVGGAALGGLLGAGGAAAGKIGERAALERQIGSLEADTSQLPKPQAKRIVLGAPEKVEAPTPEPTKPVVKAKPKAPAVETKAPAVEPSQIAEASPQARPKPVEPPKEPVQSNGGQISSRAFTDYEDLARTPEGKNLTPDESGLLADVRALMTGKEGLAGRSWETLDAEADPKAVATAVNRLDDPHYAAEADRILERRESGRQAEFAGVVEETAREGSAAGVSGRGLVEEAVSQAMRIRREGVGYYDLHDLYDARQREEIYEHIRARLTGKDPEAKLYRIPGASEGTTLRDAIVDMGIIPESVGKRYEARPEQVKESERLRLAHDRLRSELAERYDVPADQLAQKATPEEMARLKTAEEAVLRAEEREAGTFRPRNREELAKTLRKTTGVTKGQAEAQAAVFDAVVQATAKRRGVDAETIYEKVRYRKGGRVEEGALRQEGSRAPTFFSQALKVLEAKMPNRASAAQVRGILDPQKGSGVKPEELKWTGLDDLIAEREKSGQPLTKAEVLEFVRANRVEVREVIKDDNAVARWWDSEGRWEKRGFSHWDAMSQEGRAMARRMFERRFPDVGQTRYGRDRLRDGTLPGGQNYRELLLTLPEVKATEAQARVWYETNRKPGSPEWSAASDAIRKAAYINAVKPTEHNFRSSHWEEKNVLAHVRFDERVDADGKKVLHVAEIQSDWHQAGRKQGYRSDKPELPPGFTVTQLENGGWVVRNPDGLPYNAFTRDRSDALRQALAQLDYNANLDPALDDRKVPAAPFAKTWHELALKRILRWAAENDFDRVTWDTGATAAERFDLSKQIDKLTYKKLDDGTYRVSGLRGYEGVPLNDGKPMPPERLEDWVGKEIAERIIEGRGVERNYGANNEPRDIWTELEGVDLKVGGEGMKGFYDAILPTFAAKYGKKWGAKVGKTDVTLGAPDATQAAAKGYRLQSSADGWQVTGPDGNVLRSFGKDLDAAIAFRDEQAGAKAGRAPAHYIDVTPSMKESVLSEGQPLHQQTGPDPQAAISFDEANNAVISFFESANVTSAFHEHAHFFRRVALDEPDLKIAEAWAGVSEGKWTVAAEEKFARGFERYLRDGKAPTSELRKVFEKLRKWFVEVYEKITGSEIDVKLSPEMQDLFDRMLGGEGRIARKAAREARVPKEDVYLGSLNKLKLPEEVRGFVEETYNAAKSEIDAHRRGTRTWEQTNDRARELLKSGAISVEKLKDSRGRAFNAEEQMAVARLHLRLLDDVQAAAKKYQDTGAVSDLERLEAAKAAYDIAHLAHQGAATEAGRALNARKQFLQAYRGELAAERVQKLYEPLPDTTEKTTKRREAAVKATIFPREAGVAALERLRRRFGGTKLEGEQVLFQRPLPDDLRKDLIDLGGWLLESKFNTEAEWKAELRRQVGAGVEPYLDPLWKEVRSEAQTRAKRQAKAKKAPQDQAKELLTRMLDGAAPGEDLIRQLAAAGDDPVKLADVLRKQQDTSAAQWFSGAYKSSLTSGPRTHLTNLVSTQLHMALRAPDKFFTGAWDAVISKLPGREREHFVREALPSLAAARVGFTAGLSDWLHTMRHGATQDALRQLDLYRELPGGLKNPFVVNQRLQSATDAFNKSLVFHQAAVSESVRRALKEGLKGEQLSRRVRELLDSEEVMEAATREAKEYTFNSDAEGWAKKILELREKAGVAGHLIVPFASTPINVAKSAWMHSPAGFITAIQRLKDGGDVADALGKATTGTLLLTGAAAALRNTEITGAAPQDSAARDDFYRTGRQPYAFRVGDRWVSYQSQGPLTTILAVVASMRNDYWDRGKKEPLPVWVRGVLTAAQSFKDQSALTGLSAISEAIDNPERRGQAFLNRQATGLIPFSSLLRTIEQGTDPYLRHPQGPGESIRSIIPGVGQDVPPRRDVHGRPVKREPGGLDVTQRFVVGKKSNDPVDRELHRLKVFPSTPDDKVKVGDETHKLSRAQYDQYRALVGEVVYAKLQQRLADPRYPTLPDAAKDKLLRDTIRVFRSDGRKAGETRIYGAEEVLRLAIQQGRDPIGMLKAWRDRNLSAR